MVSQQRELTVAVEHVTLKLTARPSGTPGLGAEREFVEGDGRPLGRPREAGLPILGVAGQANAVELVVGHRLNPHALADRRGTGVRGAARSGHHR